MSEVADEGGDVMRLRTALKRPKTGEGLHDLHVKGKGTDEQVVPSVRGRFEMTLVPSGLNPAAADLAITDGFFDLTVQSLGLP